MTKEEIKEVIRLHGLYLSGDPSGKRADFRGANLEGANFRGVNLRGALLGRANFDGANFRGTLLGRANFSYANLRGALLGRANFRGANLEGADLEGAYLEGVNLDGANLEGADFRRANLEGADFRRANFDGADFRRANFDGADFRGSELYGADLRHTDLSYVDFSYAYLRYADFRGANFRGANLEGADFRGAYLVGADFRGANLEPIKKDMFDVLLKAIPEIPALKEAIKCGKINGSTYEGECACLCGTIEKSDRVKSKYGTSLRDSCRPIERFFLTINKGDTPETNYSSKLALEWIEEFEAINKLYKDFGEVAYIVSNASNGGWAYNLEIENQVDALIMLIKGDSEE